MAYATLADIPTGERNVLNDFRNQWEMLIGFAAPFSDEGLLVAANAGVTTLAQFSALTTFNPYQPWAHYGINADQYASLATTYGTAYKTLTGQEIPQADLAKAFTNQKDVTGGFLSGTQYAQQLQQDKSIQDTYGWVKYGLDYQQFQQHKAGMTQAFGGAPSDSQGVQALQFWHANAAATQAAQAKPASEAKNAPVTPGEAQSVIR